MSADPITQINALGLEPTYSAREAAVLLGRSYSWLDQRLRKGQFILRDGTSVQPLRTPGGYRRFTTAMLRDIALSHQLRVVAGLSGGQPDRGRGFPRIGQGVNLRGEPAA